MKVLEVEIEDEILEDLGITSSKITYNELRKQIAAAEARRALEECSERAREEGLDKMSEEDLGSLVRAL
jgi:hypothetical protein